MIIGFTFSYAVSTHCVKGYVIPALG